jgi:hypothetical protein
VLLCSVCGPSFGQMSDPPGEDTVGTLGRDEVLEGYNTGIARAMADIETLRVEQELVEPTDNDGMKRALAVLLYDRENGMEREELSEGLGHPVGEYGLSSLVGPELLPDEYDVTFAGVEDMEGLQCYRLDITATERDAEHFDGTVWVDTRSLGLVRIVGEVADPPFPVRKIKLDKAFEPTPEGLWLLRRHTGEIDIKLALIRRRGMMHIFYTNYSLTLSR